MSTYLNDISKFVDENREEIISLWKDIVNTESYTNCKESVNILAEKLKTEFEKEGLDCNLIDVGNNGNTLVGTLGSNRNGKPIIFSGHMDTVFEIGTFGENPFKIEDGKAYGPGVLDMKGGIVISLYVIKALNKIGYNERPIKIVFSGDEETGHRDSAGGEIMLKEGQGGLCAFNMETGLVDNSLCVGRKGRIGCNVHVKGVETHAGNDFEGGRNAIEEMANKILKIQRLTNLELGTTVTVSVIKGGRVPNSIPQDCNIEIDIRFEKVEEAENVKKRIEEICKETYIEGTSTEVKIVNEMMAFETTEDVMKFYEFVNTVSKENGFGEINAKKLGGSSDASYLTIGKVPTICSFGVKGEWNHTSREYALVDSMFERVKLISEVILNLDKFEI
ncbi:MULTISPECIES: M20 family metallopeptidase [unclassified Clostridioides]|uniref:M20 family metallopeptidase n=1 Tax=unclassified Clostridioides TaxID=2635829 RepID=UPI001D118E91|nr:M20 family metallopeptidase [Clostridioides sp. ZZV14-6154]MCC0668008.1 M20 family metallopeptidase [Clostridioides sp. ZZV14-6153]MCC0717465.1 M20 family metallopeptidase [Clostridioides sp. ZZV14-6105]MCC0721407.1 M20 family metallopeptidase [Clostridioides sp. ZZV14-6104]MCC0725599.1 M20 family metallopeptidase [Clostridioides sp. ZZV14-6045]MCC0729697.1 M20 family metallopeptidase [Clostridioides sp. ZZV14-6048]MCC0737988.1 M20 family metallopeptidase [Clostridioides sp. ZZV14-5902]MC